MLRLLKQYFPIRNIIFYIFEGFVIFGSILLSMAIFASSYFHMFDFLIVLRILLITFICQVCLYYNDLYDFDVSSTLSETSIRLLQSLGITSIALAFIYYIFPLAIVDQKVFILSIVFLLLFIIGWRLLYIQILNKGVFNEHIMILGSGSLALDIFKKIFNTLDCGYTVSIMIPDSKNEKYPIDFPDTVIVRKGIKNLSQIASEMGINKVIVALKEKRESFPMDELIRCRTGGIEVIEGSTFYEMLTGKVLVTQINPSWLVFSDGFRKSRLKTIFKRIEDIILSLIMLVLLSPLLCLVGIFIKFDSKGPVFFSQDRVGLNKKEYRVHKFRSMVENAEKSTGPVWARHNDIRITTAGKIIRKYRIDELPQLWDVLIGNMSLVGPRPERKCFTDKLEKQIPFYSQRFNVKPGVTGWAQVSYTYGATVDDAIEKLNYDLFYIKNMSLTLDVIIILRTIKTVLFGRGAR
ncbi:TIGR03013 family XrtA/PEP-CTERM system glycosyltransferase [Desulfobacula phenolica]|uniref:Sugar transferase, PEP-CTERM system associated/exopolysaccharide biosynthesis polyprenyl glycosylphosphotransferase n=1 Tax=Desulfobacula phenolica TaxID=90732 RepID=A0A1H2ENJ9_9BACT|nr:TIGR03013 family XrtA/PEP-CTERM system glycosyltransferase [Desulfobacula phenolica]SDT96589.1 sugar transferase, PEP-CTERM system associated/exopolysaccharide biosynthesis polyprenyl glycosylphosphotransferase [Desulfobacula phenolica]